MENDTPAWARVEPLDVAAALAFLNLLSTASTADIWWAYSADQWRAIYEAAAPGTKASELSRAFVEGEPIPAAWPLSRTAPLPGTSEASKAPEEAGEGAAAGPPSSPSNGASSSRGRRPRKARKA